MSSQRLRLTLLLGSLVLGVTLGARYECIPDQSECSCTLTDVLIQTELDANALTIEQQSGCINLENANISYLSQEIWDNPGLKTVRKLYVVEGTVPKIYLKPALHLLWVDESKVEELIIPKSENIMLIHLDLADNLLTEIPNNIEYCKELRTATLANNRIQSVDLSHFSGLQKLERLDLSYNRIHSVDTPSVVMAPLLKQFDLSYNKLKSLDIEKWDFPKLQSFRFESNMLTSVGNLAEVFPTLEDVQFHENAWSCVWLNKTLESLKTRTNINLLFPDFECSRAIILDICCTE